MVPLLSRGFHASSMSAYTAMAILLMQMVLVLIAVRLSKLEKKGWRPRRTIIVYSWDAEEFVLVPDPDDRSHILYDYMIRQNPPKEWPVGEQTLQLLSSTLESLHLTSLMDYVSENVFDGA
ncbi:hypothetical protein ZWY2020_056325 [Hordeum vulgare]|nr:hypothetical protein ZWY2020_056325 [Hordeum vulgare]